MEKVKHYDRQNNNTCLDCGVFIVDSSKRCHACHIMRQRTKSSSDMVNRIEYLEAKLESVMDRIIILENKKWKK